ncbi:hypothetical protein QE389_002238 [Brevundimonas sp. SORGH_AS 993]|nr:hypothetical protein [Brevundimonas sp. SORGH_AS_0993]
MSRLLAFVCASALLATPVAAQSVDRVAVNGIIDQGLNHSQVMQTAAYLTDRIGGRMTNSPQMREAERWAQAQFRDYGLSNVRAEGFEFGRGWSIVRSSARMTAPRPLDLRAIPVAWTPSTNGTISAGVVVAPLAKVEDFDKWRGKLAGKIVMISPPGTGSEPTEPAFKRWTSAELAERNTYNQPQYSPAAIRKSLETADFASKLDAFLVEQGALAWVRISQRDGGLLHGTGYTYQVGATPRLAGMELAAEDYRRLARLALTEAPPTLELMSEVRFHDEDVNAYNILADIPGTGGTSEYVMAGAHLDSWVASDGAQDNAAGSAVVMEAARILKALNVRPKRTIRFALWNGEEQGDPGLPGLCRPAPGDPRPVERSGLGQPAEQSHLAQPLADPAAPRLSRSGRLFQPGQRLGQDSRHQRRRQCRRRPDLSGMAGALRQHGGHDRVAAQLGRHRPCLYADGRRAGVSVHPGPARLFRAHPPHQHRQLRPPEGRGFASGGGHPGQFPAERRQPRRPPAAHAAAPTQPTPTDPFEYPPAD